MRDDIFHLIDERDVRLEGPADAFRVALWHGTESDPQDLTSVAFYESASATLDETLDWAKLNQDPATRLIEVFAIVDSGKHKTSVQIASYDYRPPLNRREASDTDRPEGSAFLGF